MRACWRHIRKCWENRLRFCRKVLILPINYRYILENEAFLSRDGRKDGHMNLQIQSNGVKMGGASSRMQMAANAVNRKSLQEAQSGKRKDGQERREDRVQISSNNWMQERLGQLMERKQDLIERKNELIASGGDWDSIKAMVAFYEEQISNVETEISQTMKEMVEEQLEKAEEEKKNEKEPETKEEQQMQYLNNLSNASMDYKQVSQVHKAHDQKKRDASVMSMEVKLDDSRGGASKGKREHLGEVLAEADQLYRKAMKGYVNLNSSLADMEEENVEKQKETRREEELEKVKAKEEEVVSWAARNMQDTARDEKYI